MDKNAICIESGVPQKYLKFKNSHWMVKGKKAIPLQTCTGPEGSRRLRFPDVKTIST